MNMQFLCCDNLLIIKKVNKNTTREHTHKHKVNHKIKQSTVVKYLYIIQ